MKKLGHKAKSLFDRLFPERQIYHRSGGTVRYISLSPSKQALIALAGVGVAGWTAYLNVNWMMGGVTGAQFESEADRRVQTMQRWLAESRAREASAEAQLKQLSEQFEKQTVEFERRHATLKMLLDYAGGASITAAARPIERDGARLLMQASIEESEPRVSRSWNEPTYRVQTVGYRARVDRLKSEQTAFLATAEEVAVEKSEEIRGVLRLTGVGFSRLTAADADAEMGGPLVPIDLTTVLGDDVDPAFSRRAQQVAARVAEARRLQDIIEATPLAPPVGVDYRETSGFGPRVDPFTGAPAFHAGLDLTAFEKAPVIATSPGVVVVAEPRSGFGLFVEIDHGHGFKTRYAHLRDIQVRVGERVQIGQRIGSMGSTGRSTGTHLHYEIWFRGMVYDPVSFLRAGRHVYEQG
jgi:murein DD-endopeptidase MepM/ murein hydrolase activator NlpD